ncbi:MAG: chorismate-binding protein [Bdellovibrionota bacterium]
MKMTRADIKKFLNSGALFGTGRDGVSIGWGSFIWKENRDPLSPAFYAPDFFLREPRPWLQFENHIDISNNEISSLMRLIVDEVSAFAGSHHRKSRPMIWSEPDKTVFEQFFYNLKKRIGEGSLIKGVPYSFATARYGVDPGLIGSMLLSLLRYSSESSVWPYGFWTEGSGILGASPEMLLFSNEAGLLNSMALAGSCGDTDLDGFMKNQKELHEHSVVVDTISEVLSRFGRVKASEMEIRRFPGISHMMTPIKVVKDNFVDFDEVVIALHPTPALGAFPKEQGLKWLEILNETVPRRRFGAPFGFFPAGNKCYSCVVAIRNVQWQDAELKIGAGCGVVAESELEREWAELHLKLSSVRRMLGL